MIISFEDGDGFISGDLLYLLISELSLLLPLLVLKSTISSSYGEYSIASIAATEGKSVFNEFYNLCRLYLLSFLVLPSVPEK